METRNITLTIDKAREWYNSNNEALREAALQAFTEKEIQRLSFNDIKTFEDAVKALNLNEERAKTTFIKLEGWSKASAAMFKLNIIRKALNKDYEMSFVKNQLWYPTNPVMLTTSRYYQHPEEGVVAKIKIGNNIFNLLGGNATKWYGTGLGNFSDICIGNMNDSVGFLGCATKEIAQHFGKYFAEEIFEAKYGDYIDYTFLL